MPSNVQNVSFANPLDPAAGAQLAVQQQAIQRQLAIAQQLQQQSLQEDKVASGSHVSPTQGLARLANALIAKQQFKKTQGEQVDLATKQGQMMQRMFGIGQPPQPGSLQGDQSGTPTDNISNTPAPQSNIAAIAAQLAPQAQAEAQAAPGGADDAVVPPPQAAPQPQQAPQQPAQQMPPQAPPQGNTGAPMSLTGDPTKDYLIYSMGGPEKYAEAMAARSSPTDVVKNAVAAGYQPGTPQFQQYMQANAAKANFIPPTNMRGGGTAMLNDGSNRMIYNPTVPEGYEPVRDAQGNVTGIQAIPGGPAAVQGSAAAKAVGSSAGDLVDVFNPATHQMVKVPKSALLSGAANGQAPMAAGPALGATKAFDVTGQNSANAFQAISDGAADVPNRLNALHQMQSIVADPNAILGPGSETAAHIKGVLGTIGQTAGIQPPASVDNYQEFSKWASQYSARSAQELGLSGSDARVQLAIHATPNGEMTKGALSNIIPQMIGMENAKQGYAVAANQWQQAKGPQDVQAFRTQWNKVYDPRIYSAMAQGPQAVRALLKNATPADRQALIDKSNALAALGALPK